MQQCRSSNYYRKGKPL